MFLCKANGTEEGGVMGSFKRSEGFILNASKGLVIFPVYISSKSDPTVAGFIENFFPDKKEEILCHHDAGDTLVFPFGKEETFLVYYLPEGQETILPVVYNDVAKEILNSKAKDVSIALFGSSEYGYDETKNIFEQEKWLKHLVATNPTLNIHFVVTDDDHRPQQGKHMSDGPVSAEEETVDERAIPKDLTHHLVTIDLDRLHSYREYFAAYIDGRSTSKEFIRSTTDQGILDTRDLGYSLAYYLQPNSMKPYPMAKWGKPQKGKDGKIYAPKPSKQLLKFIIILLDMSYDEAVSCLSFFGYGLAQFDKEDMAFKFMLKNWPKPIDPIRADKALVKRFGRKASIINDK
jgi:hypothetical protein